MSTTVHGLSQLNDPIAQALLTSTAPARLAYTWTDGTPRVVPIWFHWDGATITLGSPLRAPKLRVLGTNPEVAVTIDTNEWPYRVLSIRGRAEVDLLDDVAPEYAEAAERYLGRGPGQAWVAQLRGQRMGRIRITPQWVNILDFETRVPSALTPP